MTSPDCNSVRELMDSYLGDELLVETNHLVHQHVAGCDDCRRELAARRRLRALLKEALPAGPDPAHVEARVRQQIATTRPRASWLTLRSLGTIAAAAVVVAGVALAWGLAVRGARSPAPASGTALPAPPSPAPPIATASVLPVVYRDSVENHVECALTMPSTVTWDAARVARNLDPAYRAIVNAVERAAMPYHVTDAHDCEHHAFNYKHLVLRGEGRTISVLTLREPPRGRPPGTILLDAPRATAGDTARGDVALGSIWAFRQGQYEAAAMESGGHLTLVVSDLSGDRLAVLAARVLPPMAGELPSITR